MITDKCSIIIPTFNRGELLKKIITKISKSESLELIKEILICDSYSQDGTKEILSNLKNDYPKLDIQHLHTKNNISMKRNLGINNAQTNFLIFFDDDCEPNKDCIKNHINCLLSSEKKIFSGAVKFPSSQIKKDNYIRYRDSRHRYFDNLPEKSKINFKQIVTMNLALKKNEIIDNDLLFDEDFLAYGMEDNEFGYRAELKGFKLLKSRAEIIHHDWHDLDTFKKKIYITARDGTSMFLKKHPEAVWNLYYSKFFEPEYPFKNIFSKYFSRIINLLFIQKVSNTFSFFVKLTKKYKFFYFKFFYRYILACEYARGVKDRNLKYLSKDDTKKGFYS